MKPSLKHSLRIASVVSLLGLLAACGTTKPHESLNYDGKYAASQPACGEQIPSTEIAVLNVASEEAPMAAVESRFPNARFAYTGFEYVPIYENEAKTKGEIRRHLARQGCNVLVFGGIEEVFEASQFDYEYVGPNDTFASGWLVRNRFIRVMWGSQES